MILSNNRFIRIYKLLGHGIYCELRTGKIKIFHISYVRCQSSLENDRDEGKVLFIDTESTFHLEKLKTIEERFGLDLN